MLTMEYRIGESQRIATLYEIAKEKAWNARKDLEWESSLHWITSPIIPSASPFAGFAPYEALDTDAKALANRQWHIREVSDILHGEQGALQIAAQLVQLLPTIDAKLFASSQVLDEARHVEFFSRYLAEYGEGISPPSPELKDLIESALAESRIDMKLITMQIVIESLAMAKFQRLRIDTCVPILQIALEYVLRDEARHVNFGTEVLKSQLSGISADDRNSRAEYVLHTVTKLANNLNSASSVAECFGWDKPALRLHLRAKRVADPSESRAVFRQLQINLAAVGLLTDELQQTLSARKLLQPV